MAARPPSDVAEAVREVVAAFDKAVNLVRRIEDRKDGKSDPESIQDLYKSLTLGPVIVQGYFDADSKRLGHAYSVGDFTAQMQLRDVLLHLKTLVGDLQDVLLDEKQIDFRLLQDASDHCRVNAGVCLGQLSQRLANPNPMYMQSPPAYRSGVPPMHTPIQSPGPHYSMSHSTHSSVGPGMPMTPDQYHSSPPLPQHTFGQQHDYSNQPWDQKRSEQENHYFPQHQRHDTETSLQEGFANWNVAGQYGGREFDRRSERRPSSHVLSAEDGALLSPGFPKDQSQLFPGQQDTIRNSYTSFNGDQSHSRNSTTSSHSKERLAPDDFGDMNQRPTTRSSQISRERFGPDDFGDVVQDDEFASNRGSTRSQTSYASRAHDTNPEPLSTDHEQVAPPAPLRFGNRSASESQPQRQVSTGSSGTQLHPSTMGQQHIQQPTPNPMQQQHQVPYPGAFEPQHTQMPMPSSYNTQSTSYPPRSQSMAVSGTAPGQRHHQQPQPMQTTMPPDPTRQYSMNSTSPYIPQVQTPVSTLPIPNMPQTHHPSLDLGHHAQSPVQRQASQGLTSATSAALSPSVSAPIPQRTESVTSLPRPMSTSQPRSVALSQLTLPTEKNTHAFCKGAYREFVGNKKGIVPAIRSVGITISQSYWRCDKCFFEGPMQIIPGPPDKKGRPGKPEKIFDPKIRESGPLSSAIVGPDGRGEGSGGIRYKWAFLAKCHVPMKMTLEKSDGTAGSFCCIFCVAESSARGWLEPTQTFNDGGSTSSGRSGNFGGGLTGGSSGSGGGTTRVFGNVTSFMDHLQLHRREDMWPGEEMRMRMKCVVGRVASRGEDWEVNFLPL